MPRGTGLRKHWPCRRLRALAAHLIDLTARVGSQAGVQADVGDGVQGSGCRGCVGVQQAHAGYGSIEVQLQAPTRHRSQPCMPHTAQVRQECM